jgi:hypothetical protein
MILYKQFIGDLNILRILEDKVSSIYPLINGNKVVPLPGPAQEEIKWNCIPYIEVCKGLNTSTFQANT